MICWSGYVTGPKSQTAIIEATIASLKKIQARKATRFDSIIAQGMSGVLIAAPVAHALGVPLLTVGRDGEKYGPRITNLGQQGTRILFMDDHFGVGRTLSRCDKALAANTRYGPEARIVATFMYNPKRPLICEGYVPLDEKHPYRTCVRAEGEEKAPEKTVEISTGKGPSYRVISLA